MVSRTTIRDYVALQRGTTYKSQLLNLPGPILLGLASISRNGGFRTDGLRSYGGDSPEKLLLHPGDLYVSLKDVTQAGDLLGAVARVPSFIEVGRLTQDTVKLEFVGPELSREYLYWLLRTPQYRQYCRSRAIGTTNLSLSRDDFLAFPVPPLTSKRNALVGILSALEAKIEANSRLVRTLSKLAIAMLQQGADPAARFVVNLVADVRKGLSYTGAGLTDEGMAMVNLANAENFGWFKRSGLKYYMGAYKPRHIAPPGSLLVSGVDLTWRLAIIGWPMLLPEDLGPALFSHHIFLIDFRPEWEWLRLPLWAHLFAANVRAHLEGMVYGTTVATLPAEALADLEFCATPRDSPVLRVAGDLIRRAWAAERETEALSALQDTLLPLLFSDELRVRDAESPGPEVI